MTDDVPLPNLSLPVSGAALAHGHHNFFVLLREMMRIKSAHSCRCPTRMHVVGPALSGRRARQHRAVPAASAPAMKIGIRQHVAGLLSIRYDQESGRGRRRARRLP